MLLSLFALTQHGSLSSVPAGATHNLHLYWPDVNLMPGTGPSEHAEGLVLLGAQQGKAPEKQSLFEAAAAVALCLGGFRG